MAAVASAHSRARGARRLSPVGGPDLDEQGDTRLRRPGMTELIVQLLVEGPTTPEAAGEIIWRKRAAEHAV